MDSGQLLPGSLATARPVIRYLAYGCSLARSAAGITSHVTLAASVGTTPPPRESRLPPWRGARACQTSITAELAALTITICRSRSTRTRGGAPSSSSCASTCCSLRCSIACLLPGWNTAWTSSRPTAVAGRRPSRCQGSPRFLCSHQPSRSSVARATSPTTRPGSVMKKATAIPSQRRRLAGRSRTAGSSGPRRRHRPQGERAAQFRRRADAPALGLCGLPRQTAGEISRPSPWLSEPFCPADNLEYRQGRPAQHTVQPGCSSPTGDRTPVRR